MPTKMQDFSIRSFDGGLNQNRNPVLMEPDEFRVFDNVRFDEFGLPRKRFGENKLGDRLGSEAIDGLFEYRPTGAATEILAVTDGNLYSWDGSSWSSSLYSGFTSGNKVDFAEMDDLVFMVDGDTKMVKYDGTSVTDAGIEAPDSDDQSDTDDGAPNVATGAAGNLNGDYKYVITFISDTTESDPGAESVQVSPSNEKVDLSDIPTSSNSTVNARGIYRTKAGGSVFFKVDEISDNTTTTFTDDTTDSNLGDQLDEELGKPPVGLRTITSYHGFLFAGGETSSPFRLYWSKQLEPEKWDALNFDDIQAENAEQITSLHAVQDRLFIFTNNTVNSLTGFTENEFSQQEVIVGVGTPEHDTAAVYRNSLYFYDGEEMILKLSGQSTDELTREKTDEEMRSIGTPSDSTLIVDNQNRVRFGYETTEGDDRELVYWPKRDAWVRNTGRSIQSYTRRRDDTLLGGLRFEGQVVELDTSKSARINQHSKTTNNTSVGMDNQFTATKFTAQETGTILDISFLLSTNGDQSGELRSHIYIDEGGEPGRKVGTSSGTIDIDHIGTTADWHDMTIETDEELNDGVSFWVSLEPFGGYGMAAYGEEAYGAEDEYSSSAFEDVLWHGDNSGTYFVSSDEDTWTEQTGFEGAMKIQTSDIAFDVWTRDFDFERPQHRKQNRRVTANYELDQGTIFVDVYADGEKRDTIQLTTRDIGFVLGTDILGQGRLGGSVETVEDPSSKTNAIGRKLSYRIRNTDATDLVLFSISAEIYQRSRK